MDSAMEWVLEFKWRASLTEDLTNRASNVLASSPLQGMMHTLMVSPPCKPES